MGLFRSIKKAFTGNGVIFEGASEVERSEFNAIVISVAGIYKAGRSREAYLMLEFDAHVTSKETLNSEIEYRIFGNRSFNKDDLFDAY